MSRSAMLLVGGWVLVLSTALRAQDGVLGQMYGNGVHAYFAHDFMRAHQFLSAAIEGHSQDPRCYYFRGLAYLRLGRPQDAELDFQQGAKLESSDLNRTYNVAKALERVQGPDRAAVEQYRLEARMLALGKAEEQRKARYEQTQKQEQQLLQDQAGRAPEKPAGAPAESAKPIGDPFSGGVAAPKQPAEESAKPEPGPAKPAPETAKPEVLPETPAPETAKPEPGPEKPATQPGEKPAAKPVGGTEDPFATPVKPATEPAKPAGGTEDPFATPVKPAVTPEKPAVTPAKPAVTPAKSGPARKPGVLDALLHAAGAAAAGGETGGSTPAKPAPAVGPGPVPPKPKAEPAGADPFAAGVPANPPAKTGGEEPSGSVPAAKPKAKAAPTADPFAEEPAPDAKPAAKKPAAGADPFAAEPAPDAKPAAKAAKPAPAVADPFGP